MTRIMTANATLIELSSVLSFSILAIYIVSYTVRLGIPPSISASFYKLKHHILFTLTIWSTALLILPAIKMLSCPHTPAAAYVAIFGMLVVGASPRFLSRHQLPAHIFGATLIFIGSTVWVALNNPIALVSWAIFIIYELVVLIRGRRMKQHAHAFFAEIAVFISFYGAIFLKLTHVAKHCLL